MYLNFINLLFYCLWIWRHYQKAFPYTQLQRNSSLCFSSTYMIFFYILSLSLFSGKCAKKLSLSPQFLISRQFILKGSFWRVELKLQTKVRQYSLLLYGFERRKSTPPCVSSIWEHLSGDNMCRQQRTNSQFGLHIENDYS